MLLNHRETGSLYASKVQNCGLALFVAPREFTDLLAVLNSNHTLAGLATPARAPGETPSPGYSKLSLALGLHWALFEE